tara:strand:+ start:1524 stop:1811 length:288 start_codon:yes stop_codon:yes gene_type:complete
MDNFAKACQMYTKYEEEYHIAQAESGADRELDYDITQEDVNNFIRSKVDKELNQLIEKGKINIFDYKLITWYLEVSYRTGIEMPYVREIRMVGKV